MRLVVVALMLLIAGATHAAAQQYQLSPASVAARNLQVQHHAVLVNTATGDIYMCTGTLALEKKERKSAFEGVDDHVTLGQAHFEAKSEHAL
jgi:polyisoprenoid-binding protein YceI